MVLTGDETRRKEDYAPLARPVESLLDDPHYRALYTDKEWFDEFVSRSPLASIKRDFPDWEETARGMLNHAFLAEAWGVTTENISLTYDGRRVPFDEAVFGRSMGTEKEFSDAMAQLMRERVTPAEVGARVVRGAVEGTHDVRAGFYDMTAGLLRGERNPYVDLTAHAAGIRVPELERELSAAEQERRRAEHRGALREAVIANGRMESLRREIGIAQAAAQGRVEESFWGSLSRSSEELAREAQSQGEEAHTMFPEVIDPTHDGWWIMRVADSVGQSAPGTAASILNPTFGLSLMYAQTYEGALREYRSVAVERGLDPSDEAAERYAHQQAILQTPFELLGDVAVGQVLKATLRSMPKSPVAGGAKVFGEWIGERARGIAESTAGETLFTTPAQTYGEAYLAEAAGVRDQTTFGQKSLASLDAMSIALGQAGFTSGGPAIAAALVKGAKGDFTAKNLEVPTQYIALDSKGEEATPAAPEPKADSSPGSQPMEANNEDTEPGGQPAPFGVSKEGADVLAFNADPKADWEQAQVVRSTGKEIFGEAGIPQGSKLKGILAVIREWGERTGLYATHRTPALNADVKITKRAIINDLSHWAGNEKVLSVAALPKLLESAVYIQTQRLTNQPGIKQHILAAKLDIGGTPYVVSLVVREREGSLFYDHELIESDKGEPFAGTPIGTNTRGGQQDDSPSVRRVVKEALGVKPKLIAAGEAKPTSLENPAKSPYRDEAGGLILGRPISAKKDPASAETEARFLKLANDPQTADRIYDSLPDSYGGKVINPDTAREILPEYRDREGRMENTIATGGVASAYAKDRFWRELTNPHGRKKLVLMAGGPGAGKSTFVDRALGQKADLIFDGTLRDTKWAKQSIELALENGWDVSIQYVQRPMEDVFYGIVTRADVSGRWFPIRNLVQAHVDAQKSILEISREYKGNPLVEVWYFVGKTGDIKSVPLSEIDAGGKWNYEESYGGKSGEGLASGSGGDRPGQSQQDLVRANEERLRREIQERQIEERLFRYLARGDEGLLKLIGEVYGRE